MSKEVEIGSVVYIANGSVELLQGTVVHKFRLEYGPEHYVIEIDTPIDPIYEVRSWHSISFNPEGPLHIWDIINKQEIKHD